MDGQQGAEPKSIQAGEMGRDMEAGAAAVQATLLVPCIRKCLVRWCALWQGPKQNTATIAHSAYELQRKGETTFVSEVSATRQQKGGEQWAMGIFSWSVSN